GSHKNCAARSRSAPPWTAHTSAPAVACRSPDSASRPSPGDPPAVIHQRVRVGRASEGGLKYLRPRLGGINPILLGLVEEVVSPGDVIWDIGANLGLFTFAAAVAAGGNGHVLAIEPDALLVGMLRRSAATNRDTEG